LIRPPRPCRQLFAPKSTVPVAARHRWPLPCTGGWLAEPLWQPSRQVVIHARRPCRQRAGAHSGPLPQFPRDTGRPAPGYLDNLPEGVTGVDGPWGVALPQTADSDAAHFIMHTWRMMTIWTCATALLQRDFGFWRIDRVGHKMGRGSAAVWPPWSCARTDRPHHLPHRRAAIWQASSSDCLGVATQLLQFDPARTK